MTNRLPPQGAETSRGLEMNRKPTNWLLISAIVVAALALIATGLFIGLRNNRSTTTRTTPVIITPPGVPPVHPPPPPGIPPPSAGVTEGSTTINSDLIYPGAKTVLKGTGDEGGDFMQLQTSDSFDKVVNWYKEKLKPQSTVEATDPSTGLPGRSVVLAGKEIAAIITAAGDTTNIMLARGEH